MPRMHASNVIHPYHATADVLRQKLICFGGAPAVMVAAHYDLPVVRYPPTLVKSVVSGYGQGSKDQVATMVGLLLNLPTRPSPTDASDALAVALCYVQQERLKTLTG